MDCGGRGMLLLNPRHSHSTLELWKWLFPSSMELTLCYWVSELTLTLLELKEFTACIVLYNINGQSKTFCNSDLSLKKNNTGRGGEKVYLGHCKKISTSCIIAEESTRYKEAPADSWTILPFSVFTYSQLWTIPTFLLFTCTTKRTSLDPEGVFGSCPSQRKHSTQLSAPNLPGLDRLLRATWRPSQPGWVWALWSTAGSQPGCNTTPQPICTQ